ncbi:hypothetical protein FRC11_007352 [Ceratobasidium sp. 423]|nr:hypothetical protein FRC11_007352 [Ceratobasidium sp. 423]
MKCQILEHPQDFDEPGEELGASARVWRGPDLAYSTETLGAPSHSSIPATKCISINDSTKRVPFEPPRTMVLVNALWLLSLALNVAVVLIAMLSKEWCFTLMDDRDHGSHAAQAQWRQQRWEKILQYKMEEFLTLLPVVVHIALWLCVFLWDLGSAAVAIPVTAVGFLMVLTCVAFTIMPLVDRYCSYSTSTSRFYLAMLRIMGRQAAGEEPLQADVATRAIHDMITKSKHPQSVDLAVQSLSAAGVAKLSVTVLQECNA